MLSILVIEFSAFKGQAGEEKLLMFPLSLSSCSEWGCDAWSHGSNFVIMSQQARGTRSQWLRTLRT